MVGSAHFLESSIHNALMPPIPVIGVNVVAGTAVKGFELDPVIAIEIGRS
jgi:hypothetical protein